MSAFFVPARNRTGTADTQCFRNPSRRKHLSASRRPRAGINVFWRPRPSSSTRPGAGARYELDRRIGDEHTPGGTGRSPSNPAGLNSFGGARVCMVIPRRRSGNAPGDELGQPRDAVGGRRPGAVSRNCRSARPSKVTARPGRGTPVSRGALCAVGDASATLRGAVTWGRRRSCSSRRSVVV